MSGECPTCSEHTIECICKRYFKHRKRISECLDAQGLNHMKSLSALILDRMQDIGIAKERLSALLDDDIFNDLFKHNPWWESEHEAESDKLHDLRMKLGYFSEKMWEIWHILDAKHDD